MHSAAWDVSMQSKNALNAGSASITGPGVRLVDRKRVQANKTATTAKLDKNTENRGAGYFHHRSQSLDIPTAMYPLRQPRDVGSTDSRTKLRVSHKPTGANGEEWVRNACTLSESAHKKSRRDAHFLCLFERQQYCFSCLQVGFVRGRYDWKRSRDRGWRGSSGEQGSERRLRRTEDGKRLEFGKNNWKSE